jgi:hypothetical protein
VQLAQPDPAGAAESAESPAAIADRTAAFLRSLGVAGRTEPKFLGQLSKREIEVLRLLGERRLPPSPTGTSPAGAPRP